MEKEDVVVGVLGRLSRWGGAEVGRWARRRRGKDIRIVLSLAAGSKILE